MCNEKNTNKLHKRFTLRENNAINIDDIAQIKTELGKILLIPFMYIGCVKIPLHFLDEETLMILPGHNYEDLLEDVD